MDSLRSVSAEQPSTQKNNNMKILLLADLHSNRRWYEWLVRQAHQYDLISVAGDLIDIFAIDEAGQIAYLRDTWLPAMIATGVPVAISSDNHDGSAIMWLSYINELDSVIGDGSTHQVTCPSGERIIITTCPYYSSFGEPRRELTSMWEEGAQLREKYGGSWLVLHHEPVAELAEPGAITMHSLADRITYYRPDFVTSGHFHSGADTQFAHPAGSTWCFNAGQTLGAPRPNHIILDTAARIATRVRMRSVAQSLSWSQQRDMITLQ